jgi:hypothetical protein
VLVIVVGRVADGVEVLGDLVVPDDDLAVA